MRSYSQHRYLFSLAGLILLAISQVACTSTRLPPYEAEYTTRLQGIKIKGVRRFEVIGENSYKLSWQAKALWMRLNEWSEFQIIDEQVKPISYHYTRKGLGSDRPVHVYFDWQNMQVNASKGDKKYQFELQPGTLDKLSYQVQMQIDLMLDPTVKQFNFNVANYNGMRDYRFEYIADETINTRLGERETLVFKRVKKDRTTRLWVSPAQDYLPIKIEREKKGKKNTAVIKAWESRPIGRSSPLASTETQTAYDIEPDGDLNDEFE